MARVWTCGGCKTRWPRTKQKCACGRKRPASRRPAHLKALDYTYAEYIFYNGGVEACGICGAGPSENRKLDRDHWHSGPNAGKPRGLLCHFCNRNLGNRVDVEWLEKAHAYLERTSDAA